MCWGGGEGGGWFKIFTYSLLKIWW
jgi:hypothetical protein